MQHILNFNVFVINLVALIQSLHGIDTIFTIYFSDNGMIRIWDEFKVLLREICLDDEGATLSSACFLDNLANMLVAFKNHLYIIDRSKG